MRTFSSLCLDTFSSHTSGNLTTLQELGKSFPVILGSCLVQEEWIESPHLINPDHHCSLLHPAQHSSFRSFFKILVLGGYSTSIVYVMIMLHVSGGVLEALTGITPLRTPKREKKRETSSLVQRYLSEYLLRSFIVLFTFVKAILL